MSIGSGGSSNEPSRRRYTRVAGTLALLMLSHLATAASCNFAAGSVNPNPSPALNPFLVSFFYSGGVNQRSATAPPPIQGRSSSCDADIGLSKGVAVDGGDRQGELKVSLRAGLDAGLSVSANASGELLAAGSGEIFVHNERTQPVQANLPAGSLVHGHFGLLFEGTNVITISSLAQVISLVDVDFEIHSHNHNGAWTEDPNGTHDSFFLRTLGPGTASTPQRAEVDIPGVVVVGKTIDVDLHLTTTALVSGTPPSERPRGTGTLAQNFLSTFAFDFIPDDPSVLAQWASDPYFGGVQPSLPSAVPLPPTVALVSGALCLLSSCSRRRGLAGRSEA